MQRIERNLIQNVQSQAQNFLNVSLTNISKRAVQLILSKQDIKGRFDFNINNNSFISWFRRKKRRVYGKSYKCRQNQGIKL